MHLTREIVIRRKHLMELIIVAVLLAFGINLVVAPILDLSLIGTLVSIIIGLIMCMASMLYLAHSIFDRRFHSFINDAFLLYDERNNKIIPVNRYIYSERIHDYLRGGFVENSEIKTLWDKEPLNNIWQQDEIVEIEQLESAQILFEATEYFILTSLSDHLEEYFNDIMFKQENLKEYGRKDIPNILLTNRFLDLFSRPMQDRLAFVDETFGENDNANLVAAYKPDWTMYEKFNLILPKKSSVTRLGKNKIVIETNHLKLSFKIEFGDSNVPIPDEFLKYYLWITGDQNIDNITEHEINIDIDVSMKLKALFTGLGMKYYSWVDNFILQIENDVSKDNFFEHIGWETVSTFLHCSKNEK